MMRADFDSIWINFGYIFLLVFASKRIASSFKYFKFL